MNGQFQMPPKPQPAPPVPPMPNLKGVDSVLHSVLESPHFNLVIICFVALFFTTVISVLIYLKLAAKDRKGASQETERQYKTLLKYIDSLETIRLEQDQFIKRQLREGKWPDNIKARWDDDLRDMQRQFDLQRAELLPVVGERTKVILRQRSSLLADCLGDTLTKFQQRPPPRAPTQQVEELSDSDGDVPPAATNKAKSA